MKIKWQLSSSLSPNLATPRQAPSPTYKVLHRDQKIRVAIVSVRHSGPPEDLLYLLSQDLRRHNSRPPPYDLLEQCLPAQSPPGLPQCAPTPQAPSYPTALATNPAVGLAHQRTVLGPPRCQSSPPRSLYPPAPQNRRIPPSRTLTSTLFPNLRSPILKSPAYATPLASKAWGALLATCQCSLPPQASCTAPPRTQSQRLLSQEHKVILSTNPLRSAPALA